MSQQFTAAGPMPAGGEGVKDLQFCMTCQKTHPVGEHDGCVLNFLVGIRPGGAPAPPPERTPHRCPICGGLGRVQYNPQDPFPFGASVTAPTSWACHGCGGSGIVWG